MDDDDRQTLVMRLLRTAADNAACLTPDRRMGIMLAWLERLDRWVPPEPKDEPAHRLRAVHDAISARLAIYYPLRRMMGSRSEYGQPPSGVGNSVLVGRGDGVTLGVTVLVGVRLGIGVTV